jgi:hypothetical protein
VRISEGHIQLRPVAIVVVTMFAPLAMPVAVAIAIPAMIVISSLAFRLTFA